MAEDTFGLHVLPGPECLALLRENHPRIGRVAFVHEGRQFVLPVNYVVDGETVVFRTGTGSKLAVAAGAEVVAFEADAVDERWQRGWSVLVRGAATIVTDPTEEERLLALDLRPWAGGGRGFFVRVEATEVTGRRIG